MLNLKYHVIGLISACMMLAGCGGGGSEVEVIDLNKVLDVVSDTLNELDGESSGVSPSGIEPVEQSVETDRKMQDFLDVCTINMNNAKLISKPLGLSFLDDGSFEGFIDENKDGFKDAGEKQVFIVEIDSERGRLIASDTQNNRRDSGFSATGLLAGLLIGSMLGRQRSSGITSNRFNNMKMSPKNYHAGAVSKAKSSASTSSSAKARSSSGSYSSGK